MSSLKNTGYSDQRAKDCAQYEKAYGSDPMLLSQRKPRGHYTKGNRRMAARKGAVLTSIARLPKLGELMAPAEFNNFPRSRPSKMLLQ